MSLIQLIIISLVQGVTEWLPISSSGHVLLAAGYFGLEGRDELLINAMAHLGTLFAVLAYFWRDILRAFWGGLELIGIGREAGNALSGEARLALFILAATPIAVIAGIFHEAFLPAAWQGWMRSVWTVAGATILFGLALWWADMRGGLTRREEDMTMTHALLIGATQAIAALIPGTSRSGITMTAARALGYERTEAARFSMLIGAPLLAAAGGYALVQLATAAPAPGAVATLSDGLIVAILSFLSGFASIWALMALLKRMSFLPFVIYRLVLGLVLILASPAALSIFR
ncbi:MAG: UDP-diphosphatase [Alphaproteobacteria bacterium]|jgi:undecaprenyl-diphosphatase|nr:UDP-diphosphatase [Alphaproteobacteria bacterium]